MKPEEIEVLRLKILMEAEKTFPAPFLLNDLIDEYDEKLLVRTLMVLEGSYLIENESYRISADNKVSFVDVRITSKGIQYLEDH